MSDQTPLAEVEELQAARGKNFNEAAATAQPREDLARRLLGGRRLVLVSNREPYVRKRIPGGVRLERTAGGLVTALDPVMRASGGVWVAWQPEGEPGREPRFQVPAEEPQYTLRQVPLTQKEIARYYYGFANRALWPLCHYFVDRCCFEEEDWRQYVEINSRFADAVCEEAQPGDLVWVHDYHFCLLPQMLRERRGEGGPLAFFLHIPFPAEEVFRVLPWRRQILTGLLGADLVGFHTPEYAGDFLGCCERLLGATVDYERGIVHFEGRAVQVGAFPIGIDVAEFRQLAAAPTTAERVTRIRSGFDGVQLVLGVDRLDYSKGILERLHAVDVLLEQHPELRRRLVFLQIAVPSRTQVREYKELKQRIDEMVGRVNGRHGAADWQPVRYVYRSLPRHELVAFYRAADVCLVNPLRDGMNLVAMEFVAAQAGLPEEDAGVLVLSELTGAAHELGENALLINPFAIHETAEAITRALAMPAAERGRRMEELQRSIDRCDIHGWLERILGAALGGERAVARGLGNGGRRPHPLPPLRGRRPRRPASAPPQQLH